MSFTGGGVGRRGNCTRKHPLKTRAAREAVIGRLVARGAYGPSMQVVRCRYGKRDHFHVAHVIAKDRKGRRAR